jgi:hypothetical protein
MKLRMWWWHEIEYAEIPPELRIEFERYGETLMALAIESGDATRIGETLAKLGQEKREQIVDWLWERRDIEAEHQDRLETVEWAILIFVVAAVILDLVRLCLGR